MDTETWCLGCMQDIDNMKQMQNQHWGSAKEDMDTQQAAAHAAAAAAAATTATAAAAAAAAETSTAPNYSYYKPAPESKSDSSSTGMGMCDFCSKAGKNEYNNTYTCKEGHSYIVCAECTKFTQKQFKKILGNLRKSSVPFVTTYNSTVLHAPPARKGVSGKNSSLDPAQNAWIVYEKWCLCCMQDPNVMKTYKNASQTWASAVLAKDDVSVHFFEAKFCMDNLLEELYLWWWCSLFVLLFVLICVQTQHNDSTKEHRVSSAPLLPTFSSTVVVVAKKAATCRYCNNADRAVIAKTCDFKHIHSVCKVCAASAIAVFEKTVRSAGKKKSLGKVASLKTLGGIKIDIHTTANGTVIYLPTLQIKGKNDNPMRQGILRRQNCTDNWCMMCLEIVIENVHDCLTGRCELSCSTFSCNTNALFVM